MTPSESAQILAVGTELSTGEILNRNGAFLSDRLQNLGVATLNQVVVPDHREEIIKALQWMVGRSPYIFVTGGLGPTSDDFTREVIASFAEAPLEFSERSWLQLQELYRQRGLTIRDAHRQQCYFPRGSRILENRVGTAHGFELEKGGSRLFVLPGPPPELEGIWADHIEQSIASTIKVKNGQLKIFTCLGAPESEVAEVVERELKDSGWTIGYRATVPYVKVKVWVGDIGSQVTALRLNSLRNALQKWTVAEDDQDILDFFYQKIVVHPRVTIFDNLTRGRLVSRLAESAQAGRVWPNQLQVWTGVEQRSQDHMKSAHDLTLSLQPLADDQEFQLEWALEDIREVKSVRLPFRIKAHSSRGALWATELALDWWRKNLR